MPRATFFHTLAWARVLVRAFGYEPLYVCRMNGEELAACLPVMQVRQTFSRSRGKTLPFTDYCDPLVADLATGQDLLSYVVEYGRILGWRSYELRGGGMLHQSTPFFRTCYGHSIELEEGADRALSGFSSSARRNVRRASKSVRIERGDSEKFVKTYYRLHQMTRKRQGLFVQPYALFDGIRREVLTRGHGFVSLAFADERPIAGAVYVHWNRRAEYVFGASDSRFQHLRPNNAVMWNAVRWYAGQGYGELSLGTTDSENSGLRQYKNTMATRETELHYYKYDYAREAFTPLLTSSGTGLRISVCKRMPAAALSLVGTLLYPRHG